MRLRPWCLLLLLALLPAHFAGAVEVRVAVVTSGPVAPEAAAMSDAAIAVLGDRPGVRLVERAELDRAFDEQAVSLAGGVDAAVAIATGHLVLADVIVSIEVDPATRLPHAAVAFDARTGLRLIDAPLPGASPEDWLAALPAALDAALAKRDPAGELHAICFLPPRNVDLPREMDAVGAALSRILERRLLASPTIAILERARLEHVTRERLLADDPDAALLGSLRFITVEIGRDGDRGWRARALISDADDTAAGVVEATHAGGDVAALAHSLSRELGDRWLAPAPAAPHDPAAEGLRFSIEAARLYSQSQWLDAVAASEAAYALAPASRVAQYGLQLHLVGYGRHLLMPGREGSYGFIRNVHVDASTFTASAAATARALDLHRRHHLSDEGGRPSEKDNPALIHSRTLHNDVPRLFNMWRYVQPASEEQQATLRDLRQRYRMIERDRLASLEAQTDTQRWRFPFLLQGLIWHVGYYAEDADELVAEITSIVDRYAAWVDRLDPQGLTSFELRSMRQNVSSAMRHIRNDGTIDYEAVFQLSPGDRAAAFAPLFHRLAQHADPELRVQGRLGQLWVREASGKLDDLQRETAMLQLLDQLRAEIDAESPWPRDYRRYVAYRGYADAIGVCYRTRGGFRDDPRLIGHLLELLRWQVEDKPLLPVNIPWLVGSLASQRETSHHVEMLALLDRLEVAAAETPAGTIDAQASRALSLAIADARRTVRQANPQLTEGTPPPWSAAHLRFSTGKSGRGGEIIAAEARGDFILILVEAYAANLGVPHPPDRSRVVQLIEVPLGGGDPKVVNQAFPERRDRGGTVRFGAYEAAFGDRHVVLNRPRTTDLIVFPRDGGEPFTLTTRDGLPSEDVTAMAIVHDTLMLGLGDPGYLVRCDLRTREVEVVASSRRADGANALEGEGALRILALLPDPERNRALFTAYAVQDGGEHVESTAELAHGVWEYRLDDRGFRHVHPLTAFPAFEVAGHTDDDAAMVAANSIIARLDRRDDSLTILLHNYDKRTLGPNLQTDPASRLIFEPHGPFVLAGDWLWSGARWRRAHLPTHRIESLPHPYDTATDDPEFRAGLQRVGDGQLLAADRTGVWLLELPHPKSED